MIRTILVFVPTFLAIYIFSPLLLIERQIVKRINPTAMYRSVEYLVRLIFKAILFVSGVKLTVKGQENIPKDRAVLFIGNHRSYFDIIILYAQLTCDCGIVAKKELGVIPLLSVWMDSIHCFLLDREKPRDGLRTILAGADNLKNGISMILYAEGTRSKLPGYEMNEFKGGAFKMATRNGSTIIPVAVTHTDELFEKHKPFIRSGEVTLAFGAPIETAGLSRPEQKELPGRVFREVEQLLKENW